MSVEAEAVAFPLRGAHPLRSLHLPLETLASRYLLLLLVSLSSPTTSSSIRRRPQDRLSFSRSPQSPSRFSLGLFLRGFLFSFFIIIILFYECMNFPMLNSWLCGNLQNADVANFSIYVHSAPGFVFNESTSRSTFFRDRQLKNSIQVFFFFFLKLLFVQFLASVWLLRKLRNENENNKKNFVTFRFCRVEFFNIIISLG